MFHDSIEFFLQLICDYKNINVKNPPLMEYFEEIEKKGGIVLEEQESIRKFNNSRSSLKHKGLLVSKSDIEVAKAAVLSFFLQNTSLVFETDFDSLSLIEFVTYLPTKEYLQKAEKKIFQESYTKAINDISMAFDLLINDYIKEKLGDKFFVEHGAYSIFQSKQDISTRLLDYRVPFEVNNNINHLNQFAKDLEMQIDALRESLKINALDIDYRKYIIFRKYVIPPFRPIGEGVYFADTKRVYTKEECQFCMDFVIESAIKVQELDLDI
jgi:hypothetical protein